MSSQPISAVLLALISSVTMAADAQHSAIAEYRAIHPMPGATERPDKSLRYRVVFDVTKAASQPSQLNPSLEKVARLLNLLGADGVQPARNDVSVIIHGPATDAIRDDASYRSKYQVANPNLQLIAALAEAGVSFRVCSQALHARDIAPARIAKYVQVDLAALTTLANLQLRGYALIPD